MIIILKTRHNVNTVVPFFDLLYNITIMSLLPDRLTQEPLPEAVNFSETLHDVLTVLDDPTQFDPSPNFFKFNLLDRTGDQVVQVVPISMEPTGARRAFLYGLSTEQQYVVTAHTADGPVREVKWLKVDPTPLHEETEVRLEQLEAELYLYELNDVTVARVLGTLAVSKHDCIDLLKELRIRGTDIPRIMTKRINTILNDMAHMKITSNSSEILDPLIGDEMFYILKLVRETDPITARKVTSRVTTQLLHAMRGRLGVPSKDELPAETQRAAANTAISAIRSGAIPYDSSAASRLFSYGHMYRYDEGLDLLHERLSSNPELYVNQIFGIGRLNFVHDFLLHVIDGRLKSGDLQESDITDSFRGFIDTERSAKFEKPSIHIFTNLFGQAAVALNGDSHIGIPLKLRDAAHLADVAGIILSSFEYQKNEASHRAADQKCTEIIDTIIYPHVLRAPKKPAL